MAWLLLLPLVVAQADVAPGAVKAVDPAPAAAVPAQPATAQPAASAEAPATRAAAAKVTAKAAPAAPASDSTLPMIVYLGPLVLLFYLMIIRPQQQQDKKRKQLIEAVKKNDKVLTTAGIYGTVVSIDPAADKVVLRVDDDKGVKFTFSKASIVRVIDPPSEKASESTSS